MGGLEILMDKAALVELAQRRCDADGEPQKISRLYRHAEQPRERLSAGVIEYQQWPAAFAHQLKRSCRPRAIEFVLQAKLVREALKAGG
ncbi:hypothetical protein PTKU46_94350 [Paraburkholderia terrae]